METCSYCATKFATGQLFSSPIDKILCNFDNLLRDGYRTFALCAEDTGAYGQDIGEDFPTLLSEILKRKDNFIINIRQHSPNWIVENLDSYLKVLSDKRVKSIMLPFQSGSDKILNLMGRRYSSKELSDMINIVHNAAPHLMLRTHAIVGFPRETEEDFEKTVRFIDGLPWDMVLVFPYTNRPRTKASRIEPQLSKDVIVKRSLRLAFKVLWKIYLNSGRPYPLVFKNPMGLSNN